MKILIVGGGGREHALAWKCARSQGVDEVLVAPGNAGTAREPGVRNVPVAATDIDALVALARHEDVALTIVGPEDPLVLGIADRFESAGLRCFGPSAKAARLEGSKAFMKDFLARHGIPTARHASFGEVGPALEFARTLGTPVVIKTDGLAAGKGVIISQSDEETEATLRGMLTGERFGEAGRRVVVEEFLPGEEASFIAMVDGRDILPLASSQDHKTRDEGDVGPNTGGMGAYSPAPVLDDAMHERVMNEILRPTVDGMLADGYGYRGFLYAGLMIGPDGAPRVLEYNCRFGDPETQPILMRLRSDLVRLCMAAHDGTLGDTTARWDERAALGVVLAAGGYPDRYEKGKLISGLDGLDSDDTKVFHAGTKPDDGNVLTSGGRVLCVVGLGDDVAAARLRAYAAVEEIDFEGCFYRRDIGHRALTRD